MGFRTQLTTRGDTLYSPIDSKKNAQVSQVCPIAPLPQTAPCQPTQCVWAPRRKCLPPVQKMLDEFPRGEMVQNGEMMIANYEVSQDHPEYEVEVILPVGILIMDDIFLMDMIRWENHWLIISQLSPGIPNMLPLWKFHYHRATIVTSHTCVKMQLGPYDICVLSFNVASLLVHCWLVVLTMLKNISQWEGLSHILWEINNGLKPPTSIKRVIWWSWSFTHVSWND